MSSPVRMLRLVQMNSATSRKDVLNSAKRYSLQIACRVKPNTSANREGITAVGPERVNVCVAAPARDGEANAAVGRVFSQVLNVAKTDVSVVSGLKSRDKIVRVDGFEGKKDTEEGILQVVRQQLEDASADR
ncbi:hypothetical protein BJX70DRAFT_403195 [Aspergillus crustosus]